MKKSKLQLKTETVRELQPRQLTAIAGGFRPTLATCQTQVKYQCNVSDL